MCGCWIGSDLNATEWCGPVKIDHHMVLFYFHESRISDELKRKVRVVMRMRTDGQAWGCTVYGEPVSRQLTENGNNELRFRRTTWPNLVILIKILCKLPWSLETNHWKPTKKWTFVVVVAAAAAAAAWNKSHGKVATAKQQSKVKYVIMNSMLGQKFAWQFRARIAHFTLSTSYHAYIWSPHSVLSISLPAHTRLIHFGFSSFLDNSFVVFCYIFPAISVSRRWNRGKNGIFEQTQSPSVNKMWIN